MRLSSGICSGPLCVGKSEGLIYNRTRMLCMRCNSLRLDAQNPNRRKRKIFPTGKLKKKNYVFHKRNVVKKIRVKKPLRQQPQTEKQKLVKLLDKIFSIYIRKKYGDKCYTCELERATDNGHYQKRKNMGARWLEDNCRPQGPICNGKLDGNMGVFRARLIEEIGIDRVLKVEELAKSEAHFTLDHIKELIETFSKKIDLLK